MTAARLVLLGVAVLGAVARPWRLPAFVAPVVCALIALGAGVTSVSGAGEALRPLASPLAFLAVALPLAALLDRLGYFRQLARLVSAGPRLAAGLWVLAAVTVGLLNLDAAVVLLTPLYVRIARATGESAACLAFQPVVLALLGSSFLPVSNLTNLIAAGKAPAVATPVAFLSHLAIPGLVACAVGWLLYRRARPAMERAAALGRSATGPGVVSDEPEALPPARDDRVLLVGSVLVALVVTGFVAGPGFGVHEWEIALGADVVLMAILRQVPLSSVPWKTILLAAGLGLLAAAAVRSLPLSSVLAGSGPLAELRIAAAAAAGANVLNNLPALLVSLHFVVGPQRSCGLWPLLLGVNMGPSLVVTGSLASLLWIDSMRQLGLQVSALGYLRIGLRVGLPAFLAGLGVLIALSPAFGCG